MTEFLEIYVRSAVSNDFFMGGLAIGAMGAIATLLRAIWIALIKVFKRLFLATVTLDNLSPKYRYFFLWMEKHGVLANARQVRLMDSRWAGGTKGYAPAEGRRWFFQAGKVGFIQRSIDEKSKIGPVGNQRPMETLDVTLLFGKLSTITGWMEEGRKIARSIDRARPSLHVLQGQYWENMGALTKRDIATVFCDDHRLDSVLDDMRWFYDAKDWYDQRCIPWRRGYLFYGPPGTGKSSLIRALGSELNLDIATLDIGRVTLTDDDLREAMSEAPNRSIIAIEDIDAIFSERKTAEKATGVSFSGLLNAIDGIAAQEGRALVMTTNHRERLDPALIRPGRADLHVELGLISAATASKMFLRFFPNQERLAKLFEANIGSQKRSAAEFQQWLVANCQDAEAAANVSLPPKEPALVAAE